MINFLTLYNAEGNLEWSVNTDYVSKIVVDSANSLIIGTGYYFPNGKTGRRFFTIAFDLKTGHTLWDFPTLKAYNPSADPHDITVCDLFQVNSDTYALIIGLDSSPSSYKIIFFDKDGKVFKPMDLPDFILETNNYSHQNKFSVIYKLQNQFEIVNSHRTTRFEIYDSQ